MATFLAYIFSAIIVTTIVFVFRSKDKSYVFCPIVFFGIYYLYYIIYPFFFSNNQIYQYSNSSYDSPIMLLVACIVNYSSILFSFKFSHPSQLSNVNSLFDNININKCAFFLLFLGFSGYAIFNGLNLSIVRVQNELYDAAANRFNHSSSYITGLIALFPTAACLFYVSKKNYWLAITTFISFATGIIGGSRYRLVLFVIPLFVFYHLYPKLKTINFRLFIPLSLAFVVLMGIIEKTRNYGSGLDLTKLSNMTTGQMLNTKASESAFVYSFSLKVMNYYEQKDLMPYDVFGTAFFMPIPRALFPNKPDAQYLRDANMNVLGTEDYGAAYLNVVEWYLALGWVGVVINGLILGWLSKLFWNNYMKNRNSVGSILFLGLFNGVCYILISRGYLAQELVAFVYYIPMTYFVCFLFFRIIKNIGITIK